MCENPLKVTLIVLVFKEGVLLERINFYCFICKVIDLRVWFWKIVYSLIQCWQCKTESMSIKCRQLVQTPLNETFTHFFLDIQLCAWSLKQEVWFMKDLFHEIYSGTSLKFLLWSWCATTKIHFPLRVNSVHKLMDIHVLVQPTLIYWNGINTSFKNVLLFLLISHNLPVGKSYLTLILSE